MKDAMWMQGIIAIIFVSCLPYWYGFPCDIYGTPPASQLLCNMSSQWYFKSFTWFWLYPEQEQLRCELFVLKEVEVVTIPLQGLGVKVFPNIHWKAHAHASSWWRVWWVLSFHLFPLNSVIYWLSLGQISCSKVSFFKASFRFDWHLWIPNPVCLAISRPLT